MGFPGQMTQMGAFVIFAKRVQYNIHFLLDYFFLDEHFSLFWSNFQQKILKLDVVDGPGITHHVTSVQYCGGCSVHRGIPSVLWRDNISTVGYSFSTVGNSFSTVEVAQYSGG